MGADRGFGLVLPIRGGTLVVSPLDTGGVGFDFDGGCLVFTVEDDAVLALATRIVCCCGDSCKNSRCRALANASKISVCGHAPVYRIRTKLSLLDFEVGVQTRSVHDEYQ
jgi:hypothetical protein